MEAQATSGAVFAKKITLKALGLEKENILEVVQASKPSAVDIASVIGILNEAEHDESDVGPFIRFGGNFEATNLLTGSVMQSGNLIVPQVVESSLKAQAAGVNFKEGGFIKLALIITAKYDKDAATFYTFGAKSLMKPDQAKDPLADMRALLAGKGAPALVDGADAETSGKGKRGK